MSENVTVKIGGKSEEEIAFMLAEKFQDMNTTGESFLEDFRRCLKVVRNPHKAD